MSGSADSANAVVRRFLDAGRGPDGAWDIAHTGARQDRFFSGLASVERLESVLIGEDDLVVHRSPAR